MIILALVLAIPVALLRMSPSLALRTLAGIYVEVIRGTPLLLQLVYIYYVLPSIGINLNADCSPRSSVLRLTTPPI